MMLKLAAAQLAGARAQQLSRELGCLVGERLGEDVVASATAASPACSPKLFAPGRIAHARRPRASGSRRDQDSARPSGAGRGSSCRLRRRLASMPRAIRAAARARVARVADSDLASRSRAASLHVEEACVAEPKEPLSSESREPRDPQRAVPRPHRREHRGGGAGIASGGPSGTVAARAFAQPARNRDGIQNAECNMQKLSLHHQTPFAPRQQHAERRASTWSRLHFDFSVVHLDDAVHHRQPDSRSPLLRREIQIEDAAQMLRLDPDAGVLDADLHALTRRWTSR